MDCTTPTFPVHHQLPEFAQTHVRWVGDAIHHLILCHPLHLLHSIFHRIWVFSGESVFLAGGQSFGASVSVLLMNTQDWFPLGWTGLISFAVQGTLQSLLQYHSSKASILQCSAFFIVQLSHPYITTVKTIALTRWTFVDKVMSLLFNMLSRLVIAFLLRRKRLLISWLQSPSAVIFGAPQNSLSLFPLFPYLFTIKWWDWMP